MLVRFACSRPLRRWCGVFLFVFTSGALLDVDPYHVGHEVLGAFLGLRVGGWYLQRRFGLGQLLAAGVAQQTILANAFEPRGQDVLHKAANELRV